MNLISTIQLGASAPGSMTLRARWNAHGEEFTITVDGKEARSTFCGGFDFFFHLRHAAKRLRDIRFLERRYGRDLTMQYLTGDIGLPDMAPGWPARRFA